MRAWKCLTPLLFMVVGCQLCESICHSPSAPTPVAVAPIRPGVIAINPTSTKIEFTGATGLMSHTGSFASFDGVLEMPTKDPKDATIRVAMDMNSTTTNIALLTKHVKGPDFFDVDRFPKANFVSTSIAPTKEPGTYQVAGRLNFHGVEQGITFPARILMTGEEVTLDATIIIRQSSFGMVEGARKTKDDVPVKVTLHGRRA